MVHRFWICLSLVFLAGNVLGAEVGLVTAVAGQVRLADEKSATVPLNSFVKVRAGDRISMDDGARLQLVYFDGGRQEIWQGAAVLEVGGKASVPAGGGGQPQVRTLPSILVKQLSKTPGPDGNVKAGMVRMRSMPSGGTLESVEKNYADLRQGTDAADRNPELYLLASYLELREFDKLDALLRQLGEQSPNDPEMKVLAALYARAAANARAAMR